MTSSRTENLSLSSVYYLDVTPHVFGVVGDELVAQVEDVHLSFVGLSSAPRGPSLRGSGLARFAFGVTSEGASTSTAALPPLTQASTSDARNFHRRPSLWAGI